MSLKRFHGCSGSGLCEVRIAGLLCVVAPKSDFRLTSTDGVVRSYRLMATTERLPGHVYGHVRFNDKWYATDHGEVEELVTDVVTARTFMLFDEAQ